jgi:AcrR family transcriptional regulator
MAERARDGRSTRWDPHRRERRLAIITAAVRAIEEHGPDALTGQIAQYAGVPRTHVYRHFDGKRALDLAVSAHVANELGTRIRDALGTRGSPRQIIGASIEAHLAWIEEHPNLYRFLAQHAYAVPAKDAGIADAKSVFAAELTTLVQHYLRLLDAGTAPAERVMVGVVGMVDASAAWWLEHRDVPRTELTEALSTQVWLIIENMARSLGLDLDADTTLPG